MRSLLLAISAPFLAITSALAQPADPSPWATSNPDWVAPVEPFAMFGPIHFVGTAGLSVWLIDTGDGLILLDGGLPGYEQQIVASIEALGFNLADVRWLINSHAHFDHSGGLAELKRLTGAELVATAEDRSALEGGFYLGSEDVASLNAPPVKVDRIIADGEALTTVTMPTPDGGQPLRSPLTAILTPGHTRGCTSWLLTVPGPDSKPYDVLFHCSSSVAANRLVAPPQYDGIVEDYRRTFAIGRTLQPDIFVSNHPMFFGMEQKRRALASGDPYAFVDASAFPAFNARSEQAFEAALARQSAAAAP